MSGKNLWKFGWLNVCLVGLIQTPTTAVTAAESATVRFDMPPVAAATPTVDAPADSTLVRIELRLSSMIESPQLPEIDQWLVRCQPRDPSMMLADYAPRTETSSDLTSPIQIKRTEEESESVGLSVDGSYGHLARGNAGIDSGKKNIETVEFQRHAPVQAVTASGTINRGRGVYFKLRWTATQVLEGEKSFHLTLRVPANWRSGLIDVSVVAQTQVKTITWQRETKVIGAANFVVAAYRSGDHDAQLRAYELAEAEFALRRLAQSQAVKQTVSLPDMLRQVAVKLDLESDPNNDGWVQRFLQGQADPYLDKTISKLPMSLRVAALDYADLRQDFVSLGAPQPTLHTPQSDRVVVAKPAQ